MKRSPTLLPLSREHHTALALAMACERAAKSGDAARVSQACQRVVREFPDLERHFRVEERSLLPLLQSVETQPLVQRTLDDHKRLHRLLDDLRNNDTEALHDFGQCLTAHVRFEERELFPAIEAVL